MPIHLALLLVISSDSRAMTVLQPPKVLVVDDDENILSAFKEFLKGEHCSVITANNIHAAMLHLQRKNISVLITDIRLQQESGITFLLKVRTLYPKMPVIVVTGYPDMVTEEDVKIYGAEFFLQKPLDVGKLREALRTCLA